MHRYRITTTCTLAAIALMLIALLPTGCGILTARNPDFANAETGDAGQIFVLDDLAAIANDPDLTDDEKRQALRDLGIEDEEVIDGLLTL